MAGWMQVIIVGNLGNDPELRYLQNGTAVANFSVAVNTVNGQGEDRKEEAEWFRVAAWRELGERCHVLIMTRTNVLLDFAAFLFQKERGNLIIQYEPLLRFGGSSVALQCKCILIVATDAKLLGQHLGCLAHEQPAHWIRETKL